MRQSDMQRIALIVLAAAVLAALPAAARAELPSRQDRHDALRFARAYWQDRGYDARLDGAGGAGCRRVVTKLGRGDGNIFGAVFRSEPCTIYLNVNAGWDGDGNRAPWWNVCATVIHEYGHVVGRQHSRKPESIMAAYSEWNYRSSWYPWFPACRYAGDDPDGDGFPDW